MYCFVLNIGLYINIVQIAKRHTSPVLAFNMQTRPNNETFYLILFLHVESKHMTYAFLCYLYNIIPICNTKQYIYKTNYALLHNSRSYTYNKVYTLVLGVHVCNKVI